jgi:voltage-gated potassium channel
MEDSESSLAAQAVSIFILATIIFSITCMMVRTMEEVDRVVKVEHWTYIEYTTTCIFSLEYLARLAVCNVYGTPARRWILDPMNLCDLFAVVPFYVEMLLKYIYGTDSGLDFLRALRSIRLIRLFRVFKLGKYSKGMKVMQEAIALSSQAMRGGAPCGAGRSFWLGDDERADVRKCEDIASDDMPDDFAFAAIF